MATLRKGMCVHGKANGAQFLGKLWLVLEAAGKARRGSRGGSAQAG
jgi:hypothetical protein